MANQIKCNKCGVMILEVTAKYNNGMCAPCKSDYSRNKVDEVIQGWIDNPETLPGANGIPTPKDIVLAMAASRVRSQLFPTEEDKMESLCHDFFDRAHNKWGRFGPFFLNKKEKYVLAVETFYGEVWNGGLLQYLGNESGAFANWADKAFDVIGIPELADLMEQVKGLFPNSKIPKNPDVRWGMVEKIDGDDLEKLLDIVWEVCEDDGGLIRKKLFQYLKN